MHPDLLKLAAAEAFDRELMALKKARSEAEDAAKAADAEAARADGALADAEAELTANKARQRELNREIETYEARKRSAERVLESGGGDPEAAERQVASVAQILDGLETEVLERMESQEAQEAALVVLRATAAEARASRDRLRAALPAEIERLRAAFDAIVPKRDAELNDLERSIRQKYLDLRERKGTAVTGIVKGCCRACNVVVQPQHLADLKRGLMEPCRGCGRWILPDG